MFGLAVPFWVPWALAAAIAAGLFGAGYWQGRDGALEACQARQAALLTAAQVDFDKREDKVRAGGARALEQVEAERRTAARLRGQLAEVKRRGELVQGGGDCRLSGEFFRVLYPTAGGAAAGAGAAGGGDAGLPGGAGPAAGGD